MSFHVVQEIGYTYSKSTYTLEIMVLILYDDTNINEKENTNPNEIFIEPKRYSGSYSFWYCYTEKGPLFFRNKNILHRINFNYRISYI